MIRKYALVNNNIVTSVISLDVQEENDKYNELSKNNGLVIDIEDLNPQPNIFWVLNGNKLEFPQANSDIEKLEEALCEKKINLGYELARFAAIKIGARNKILTKSAIQINTIVTQLMPVKFLLEAGALGTARDILRNLKITFTEYSDIFDKIIERIDLFERENGL